MRLTKYQKSRLLEFEWEVIDNDDSNTSWIQLDVDDGKTFERVKDILNIDDSTPHLKLLVIATRAD